MGKDGRQRAPRWNLFAERQVHIRSGEESRYVVVSRPLQIGVAAGFLALLALLGLASYHAIATHIALVAQERAQQENLAESAARAQQAADEIDALRQRSESAGREVERLSADLERMRAEHMAAITASGEASTRAAELEAALLATTQDRRRLAAELGVTPGAAPGSPSPDVESLRAEVTGLRAELERVHREAAALRRTASEARQALRAGKGGQRVEAPQVAPDLGAPDPTAPMATAATPASEIRGLQQDLAQAQATLASLGAGLEALKGAGGDGLATDAVAELAVLEEQIGSAHRRAEQLGGSFADLQPPRADAARAPSGPPAPSAPPPSPPAPR